MEGEQPFTTTTATEGDTIVVLCAGEIDTATARQFDAAIVGAAEHAPRTIVVDFTSVEFVDSSGLNVLVTAHERLALAGIALVVRGARPPARRLFGITGLDRLLGVE